MRYTDGFTRNEKDESSAMSIWDKAIGFLPSLRRIISRERADTIDAPLESDVLPPKLDYEIHNGSPKAERTMVAEPVTRFSESAYFSVVGGTMTVYADEETFREERDLVKRGRRFYIAADDYQSLRYNAEDKDDSYAPLYMVAPYDQFVIAADGRAADAPFRFDTLAVDASQSSWRLFERLIIDDAEASFAIVLSATFTPETGELVAYHPQFKELPSADADELVKLYANEHLGPAFVVTGLLMLLQHRRVRLEPQVLSRQEQRNAERSGASTENALVRLDPRLTVSRALEDVLAGRQARHPRAHEVRRHLRHLRSGRTVVVREHVRGGTAAAAGDIPYIAKHTFV
jgi:hypothetical protein